MTDYDETDPIYKRRMREIAQRELDEENPAMYDTARRIMHDLGLPWTDPRDGKTYPPPTKKSKSKKRDLKSKRIQK